MRAYFKVPLIFLVIGSVLGTLLRWHFVSPVTGLSFNHWLHTHSHVMFLGWVSNFLWLSFIHQYCEDEWRGRFKKLFVALQVPLLGMLISFPLQGYGVFSIILLTFHIVLSFALCYVLYTRTKKISEPSVRFIRAALLFFSLSTFGVFAVGPLAANGFGQSKWYFFAIFFFLHFQYNGFFAFGVMGLFFRQLKKKGIIISEAGVRFVFITSFLSCIPAYLLSVLWSSPGILIFLIAGAAAVVQLASLVVLIITLKPALVQIRRSFEKPALIFMFLALIAFLTKASLQAVSVAPAMAFLASEVRYFVLAYLHLVLIGMITFYCLAWLADHGFLNVSIRWVWVVTASFILSEMLMVSTPIWGQYFAYFSIGLFITACAMFVAFSLPLVSSGPRGTVIDRN
jgi:hypothetical protein